MAGPALHGELGPLAAGASDREAAPSLKSANGLLRIAAWEAGARETRRVAHSSSAYAVTGHAINRMGWEDRMEFLLSRTPASLDGNRIETQRGTAPPGPAPAPDRGVTERSTMMRKFTILVSLFALVVLPACVTTQSHVNSNAPAPTSVSKLGQINQDVIRTVTYFEVLQANLETMITHPKVRESTKLRLKLLEQSMRESVITVVVAARTGDYRTLRRNLPGVMIALKRQMNVLTVTQLGRRELGLAIKSANATDRVSILAQADWQAVVAQINETGSRIQAA